MDMCRVVSAIKTRHYYTSSRGCLRTHTVDNIVLETAGGLVMCFGRFVSILVIATNDREPDKG